MVLFITQMGGTGGHRHVLGEVGSGSVIWDGWAGCFFVEEGMGGDGEIWCEVWGWCDLIV